MRAEKRLCNRHAGGYGEGSEFGANASLPSDAGASPAPDEARYLRWIGATSDDYLRPSPRDTCIARGWLASPDELQTEQATGAPP